MYTSYFTLSRKPFEAKPDVSFHWFGKRHKEILSELKAGVLSGKGFQLLAGDGGVGKTTLLQELIAGFDENVKCAVIDNPQADILSFYKAVALCFNFEKKVSSKVQFLVEFSYFLKHVGMRGVKALLVIDNAQRLDQEILEEIRMLSNLEKNDGKLLSILLVGRPKLTSLLALPRNKVVRQRLTYQTDLVPLDKGETEEYIAHRLNTANCDRAIFTDDSLGLIHEFSGGIPGRINNICDHSLTRCAQWELDEINTALIEECIREQGGNGNGNHSQDGRESLALQPETDDGFPDKDEESTDGLTDIAIVENDVGPADVDGDSGRLRKNHMIYAGSLLFLLGIGVFFLIPKQSPIDKTPDPMQLKGPKPITREVKKDTVIIVPGAVTRGESSGSLQPPSSEDTSRTSQGSGEKDAYLVAGTQQDKVQLKTAKTTEPKKTKKDTVIIISKAVSQGKSLNSFNLPTSDGMSRTDQPELENGMGKKAAFSQKSKEKRAAPTERPKDKKKGQIVLGKLVVK